MTDILFINPSNSASLYQGLATSLTAVEPPTWALLLAESVRSQGYSTKIIDANAEGISDDELVDRVIEDSPRIICLVVYGQNVNAGTAGMSGASRVAKALKAGNKNFVITLIGHAHHRICAHRSHGGLPRDTLMFTSEVASPTSRAIECRRQKARRHLLPS
jgi:hypothetical protein